LPKGKICKACNKERLKRFYIRDYWNGLSFSEEFITGRDVKKGKFEAIGWICPNCGNLIIDDKYYLLNRTVIQKREKISHLISDLAFDLRTLKKKHRAYEEQYKHTDRDLEIEKRIFMQRFWMLRGVIENYGYLNGLKEGRKIAEKNHKKELEALKLSDEQILHKAKLIEAKRKLGY